MDSAEIEHARAGVATATSSVWLLTAWAVGAAASVVVNIVAARIFPKQLYGDFALALAILVWVEYAVSATFPITYQKLASESVNNLPLIRHSVLRLCLPVCMVLWGIFALAAPLLAHAFGDPVLLPFLLSSGPDIPVLGMYAVSIAVLNGTGRTGQMGLSAAGYALGRMFFITGAMVLLKLAGARPVEAVCGGLLAKSLASGLGLSVALRFLRRIPHRQLPKDQPRPLLITQVVRFGLPLGVSTVAMYFLISVDFWLVKRLAPDPAAAAYYGAARAVAFLSVFVGIAMRNAAFPSMAINLHRGRTTQALIALRTALRVVLVIGGLLCALLPATATELCRWLFNYEEAGGPMALLVVATAAFAALMVYVSAFAAADHPLQPFLLLMILAPVAVAGHVLVIPRAGIRGAAVVTLGVLTMGLLAAAVWLWRKLGARPPVLNLLRVVLATLVVAFLNRHLPAQRWLLLPKYALMAVLYATLLLAVREVRLSEVRRLLGAVHGKLRGGG